MISTILVIDDDEANVEILGLILQNMGYHVLSAHDCKVGYDIARKQHPNLIMTDYQMPGLTGAELIRQIRHDETLAVTPVIAMTADIYSKQELLDAGCDAYMVKPIRKGRLLRTIQQVLKTRHMPAESSYK